MSFSRTDSSPEAQRSGAAGVLLGYESSCFNHARYDALNRLATAANQTGFSPLWGQSFTYDGFGNLTGVATTQGSSPTLTASYDANNHAGGEDANGNPGYVPVPVDGTSAAATYDVENRLVAVSGVAYYAYAPGNKRVWRGTWTGSYGSQTRGTDEITFFSVSGQKLAAYALTTTTGLIATQTGTNYYFGGKLIKNANGWVYSDRLGSNGKFYPYGIERPSATTNGTEKFTGYFRDSETGNDYADQRYQSPGYGRFLTPDRMTGKPADPSSWNKYAYTRGDPINRVDPGGTDDCEVGGNVEDCYCAIYGDSDPNCDPNYCPYGICGTGGPGQQPGPIPQEGRQGSTNPALNTPAAANGATTQAWALVGEQLALGVLESNPDCSNFIGIPPVGGPDPATLLAEIWSGTSTVASVEFGYISDTTDANGNITGWENAVTGASAPCGTFQPFPTFCSHATIELNTNASTPDNYAPTAQAWAVTILHELGHVYQWLYSQDSTSVQYDDPNVVGPGPSQMNTANILSLCFP